MSNIWEKLSDIVDYTQKNTQKKDVEAGSATGPSSTVNPNWTRHDHLLSLLEDSEALLNDILPTIYNSLKNRSFKSNFNVQKCCLVQNKNLKTRYEKWRSEYRMNHLKCPNEGYAFLFVQDEKEIEKLCNDGLKNGNSDCSTLGNAALGVQLSKHADQIQSPCSDAYDGFLVIFKIMTGRIKPVSPRDTSVNLNPSPEYDCHIASFSEETGNQKSLFDSSQVYLYDYSGNTIREYPRQVLPYAIVQFSYKPNTVTLSISTRNEETMVNNPVPGNLIKSKITSASASPSNAKPASYSAAILSDPSPNIDTSEQCEGDKEKEYIVWNGPLTIKGLYACYVDMVSATSTFKPEKLGNDINITHKLDANRVKQKYLKSIGRLRKNHEDMWGHYYINVCELRPSNPEGNGHFVKMMNYLGRHDCVAVQKLEKDVILLLLTQGNLSLELGLITPDQNPVVMYCLFLSRFSKKRNKSGENQQQLYHIKEEHKNKVVNERGDNGELKPTESLEALPSCRGDVVSYQAVPSALVDKQATCDKAEFTLPTAKESEESGKKLAVSNNNSLHVTSAVNLSNNTGSIIQSNDCAYQSSHLQSVTPQPIDCNSGTLSRLDEIVPNVPPDILSLPPDTPYTQPYPSTVDPAINTTKAPGKGRQSNSPLRFRTSPHSSTQSVVDGYGLNLLTPSAIGQSNSSLNYGTPQHLYSQSAVDGNLSTVNNSSVNNSSVCNTVPTPASPDYTQASDDIIPLSMEHMDSPSDSKSSETDSQQVTSINSPWVYGTSLGTASVDMSQPSSLPVKYGRTYDNYVTVEITNNENSPVKVRSGCGTPTNLLYPATPETPVMDELGLMHYFTSKENACSNLFTKTSSPGNRYLGLSDRDSNNNTGNVYSSTSLPACLSSVHVMQNSGNMQSHIHLGKKSECLQSVSGITMSRHDEEQCKQPLLIRNIPLPSVSPLEQNIVPSVHPNQMHGESPKNLEIPKVGDSPNNLTNYESVPMDLSTKEDNEIENEPDFPVYSIGQSNSPLKFNSIVSSKNQESSNSPLKPHLIGTSTRTDLSCQRSLLSVTASNHSTTEHLPSSKTCPANTSQSPTTSLSRGAVQTSPTSSCSGSKMSSRKLHNSGSNCQKTSQKTSPPKTVTSPLLTTPTHSLYQYAYQSSLSRPNIPLQYCIPGYASNWSVQQQTLYYPRMSTSVPYGHYPAYWTNYRPPMQYSPFRRPLLGYTPYFNIFDRPPYESMQSQGGSYGQPWHAMSTYNPVVTQASLNHGKDRSPSVPVSSSAQSIAIENAYSKLNTTNSEVDIDTSIVKSDANCSPLLPDVGVPVAVSGTSTPLVPYAEDDEVEDEKPVVYTDMADNASGIALSISDVRTIKSDTEVLEHVQDHAATQISYPEKTSSDELPSELNSNCMESKQSVIHKKEVPVQLKQFETGFMPSPPKSSMLQVDKVRDGFLVQEKTHDIVMKSPDGKLPSHSRKEILRVDFSDEINVKQEPVDQTIDTIINFLEFERGENMKSMNMTQQHGKEVSEQGQEMYDSTKGKSVQVEEKYKQLQKKGNKHTLTEHSVEQLFSNKKIKIENDDNSTRTSQDMEVVPASDNSDNEFVETPSPIRIVKTVTGYKIEKPCKTKLSESNFITDSHEKQLLDASSIENLKDSSLMSNLSKNSQDPLSLHNLNNRSKKSQGTPLDSLSEDQQKTNLNVPDLPSQGTGTSQDGIASIPDASVGKENTENGSEVDLQTDDRTRSPVSKRPKVDMESEIKNNLGGDEKLKEKISAKPSQSKIPVLISNNSENKLVADKGDSSVKDSVSSADKEKPTAHKGKKKCPQRLSAVFEDKFTPVKFMEKKKINIKLKSKKDFNEMSKPSQDITKTEKVTSVGDKRTENKGNISDAKKQENKSAIKDNSSLKKGVDKCKDSGGKLVKASNVGDRKSEEKQSKSDNKNRNDKYSVSKKQDKTNEKMPTNPSRSRSDNKSDNRTSNSKQKAKSKESELSYKSGKSEKVKFNRPDSKEKNIDTGEAKSSKSKLMSQSNKDKGDAVKERTKEKSQSPITAWDSIMKSYDKRSPKKVKKHKNEPIKSNPRKDHEKNSKYDRKRSDSESSNSYRKRRESESESDTRSRTGSPDRNKIKSSNKKPTTPSKDKLRQEISVHDLGLPQRKELDFKIPKLSSKNRSSDSSRYDKSWKADKKYGKDSGRNSDADSDASQKSDHSRKGSNDRTKDESQSSKHKSDNYRSQKSANGSESRSDKWMSKNVSSIMAMIKDQVNAGRESPVDYEGTRTPSEINSAEVSGEEDFDLNCGFKVISEVGSDTESVKDNSAFSISDDFAADVNSALPVYGSNTKNLIPEVKKDKTSKEKFPESLDINQKGLLLCKNENNNHQVCTQDNCSIKNSQILGVSTCTASTVGKPVLVVDPFELEDFIPSVKRQVDEVQNGKQMRVTIRNDLPYCQHPLLGYSQVELVRTCLHGKLEDMRVLSHDEAALHKSVSLTLHKLNLTGNMERTVDNEEIEAEKPTPLNLDPENVQTKLDIIPGIGDLNLVDSGSQNQNTEIKVKEEVKDISSRSSSIERTEDAKKIVISPIRGPDTNKQVKDEPKESKVVIQEEPKENSRRGPIRSSVTRVHRQGRQHHPYSRKEKKYKEGWSFNIDATLDEMMENLTTCLYRVKGVSPAPKSSRPRFAHYRFRRSAVPEFLPEECREYKDFTEEAIPNFSERREQADLLDTMTGSHGDDNRYAIEQNIYTRDPEPDRYESRGKRRSNEENRHATVSFVNNKASVNYHDNNYQTSSTHWESQVDNFIGKCKKQKKRRPKRLQKKLR